MRSAEQFIAEFLRDAGVRRTFGDTAVGDLEHVPVADATLASVLADAAGRLGPGPGVARYGTTLRITSRPGPPQVHAVLDDPLLIARVVGAARRAAALGSHCAQIELAIDLAAPVAVPLTRRWELPRYQPFLGTPWAAGTRVAMLVGPGVVRAGAVDGLRAFAAAADVAVANTWGAKGVFMWDSPHHMGTCGLQARDFELLGLDHYDRVITSGLDADEAPAALLRSLGVPVVDVAVDQLGALAPFVTPMATPADGARNKLYARLSAIVQPGYVDERAPRRHPARRIAELRDALPAGGLLAAQPGRVGLWIARAFPTSVLGSVVVPASDTPGIAAALAFVARLDGRPATAVVDGAPDAPTAALAELAATRDLGFACEEWHEEDTDWSCTDELVEAAGRVVAWT